MIWLDRRDRGASQTRPVLELDSLDWRRALAVGFLQCVAMWPGTSRSMMTIAGGTLVGLRPRDAAEFSFLVGVPTLGGACVYKLAKNLLASARDGTPNLIETLGAGSVALGVAVATLSAALAVHWLVAFLNRHGLAAFGWYRIALSAVMAVAFWFGWVRIV
jgi:undecaprenyl-diphosphatase